jgi:hypothetical protein
VNRDRRWLALPLILTATFMYGFDYGQKRARRPTLAMPPSA